MTAFGELNPKLTKALNLLARDGARVQFSLHSEDEMDNDGFDHADVLLCLRRGKAFGPEIHNGRLRANVVHRGLQARVVVGGLEAADGNWADLNAVKVVTVMRTA